MRTDLLNAFGAGVAANDGTVAACFNPRHGIRVIHEGNLYEFVICFECYSAKWFKNGVRNHGFLTTGLPQPKFDRALRGAGIKLPEPAR
ncbi:hypothetical protein FYK55_27555 [Roseiconus nitratireducens]|uniref:Uncharacterized protein n=1 Tax=Roseiconus nitratireducens TaxID=2605748 RepID=A0A5M6CTF4_9BACT|nr:hypothetical protein FYK55_27555 [Roseiconus nitratireducens]